MGHTAPLPHHEPESLRRRIGAELTARREAARRDPLPAILAGAVERALEDLLYFSDPAAVRAAGADLRHRLEAAFAPAPHAAQRSLLSFAAEAALRLDSLLPAWNLANPDLHLEALSPDESRGLSGAFRSLASAHAAEAPEAAAALQQGWRAETAARLRAEGVADPAAEAAAFVGSSPADTIDATGAAVRASNLRRIAALRFAGGTRSEISNDYAAFLPFTLLLGASFVTCNPPLVDLAWTAEPQVWDPVVDRVLADHPSADGEALARAVTLEVVLANMRLLRPIFLLSEGRMGCVSLQVNPRRHDDAASMLRDAAALYAALERRLEGGVPNVVFKLPGTQAGLEACRELTAAGIGVTITVNFGLFQHLPFAQAIAGGRALFSTLAHMSGRLAFPVRDELLGKLGELGRHGIDESRARTAAAWSGVAVLKRLQRVLAAQGVDLARVKPLIASLRVYSGPDHAALPGPIPDLSEVVGTGILTVFPNVRRAFDALPDPPLDGARIEAPVPKGVFEVLRHSELFKQAYWLGPLAGAGEADDPALRPARPLALADRAATAGWTPVANTLNEFCKAYDTFVDRILARRGRAG